MFLQGCKAGGVPSPLRAVIALDIFIDLFIKTTADAPRRPKAFLPLPRHGKPDKRLLITGQGSWREADVSLGDLSHMFLLGNTIQDIHSVTLIL